MLIATPLYPPEIGGPATYAKALVDSLPAKGIEVEVVKFADVRHLPKIVRHFAYYRRVLRAAHSADIVVALDPVSVGLPAMRAARRAGKPLVVKIVGDYAWEQGQQRFGIKENLDEFLKNKNVPTQVRWLRRVQTRVAANATRVIVPSEYLKKVVTAWGIPEGKIEVIYNAVSLESPGTIPTAVAALPRPLVVSAGRLVPWKGMRGLIDAVESARASGVAVSLAIIGEGPERVALQDYAREKLRNNYFFTGTLAHADVLACLQSAHVFVLNSSYEGLSHLLIEAQTLGVPTIATRVGGNSEVVIENETGLLVPPSDSTELANALVRVLGNESMRTRLGVAEKAASARFALPTMLEKTTSFFKALQ